MALASLVSFQEQKQEQKHGYCIRYAHAFEKQKLNYFARRHSLNTLI